MSVCEAVSSRINDLIQKKNFFFSLGHVYTATGDYANALASHKQCVELIRSQLEDKLMVCFPELCYNI